MASARSDPTGFDYSGGETVDLTLFYERSEPWGAGLELVIDLPAHPVNLREAVELAEKLNRALRVPAASSGIGQFTAAASGVRYSAFLPAAMALDDDFALWLLERVLVSMAMHVQEARAVIEGGLLPMSELGTAPI